MKKQLLIFTVLLLTFSCTKTTVTTPSTPATATFDWNVQLATCKLYKDYNGRLVIFNENTYSITPWDHNIYNYTITSPTDIYVTWLEYINNQQSQMTKKNCFKRNDTIYNYAVNDPTPHFYLTVAK